MSFREDVYAVVRKNKLGCVATYGEVVPMGSGYRVKERPWRDKVGLPGSMEVVNE